jgi:hypothetical protein
MRGPLIAALTLACTAALISGATVAAASPSQPGASQAGASRVGASRTSASRTSASRTSASRTEAGPASARSATVHHEDFRIISAAASAKHQSVLATGEFLAGGYQIPGRLTSGHATDKMVFPSGTFKVARHVTREWLPLPTHRCLVRETIHGSYSLGHGTGGFKGISGTGGFVMRIRGVIRKSHGQCGGRMTVFQEITYADGTVRR